MGKNSGLLSFDGALRKLISGLYRELSSGEGGVVAPNTNVYVSVDTFGDPTNREDALDYVIKEMAQQVQQELGTLGRDMSMLVSDLCLEKNNLYPHTYRTSARVSYAEGFSKYRARTESSVEPDETKYLFLSKENPELAIDMVESSSSGKEIEYRALAPHEGYFGDVHYFSLSEVGDYNLDSFWAVPVAEGELATWGMVVSFLNKDK